jgi:hypothetical protein
MLDFVDSTQHDSFIQPADFRVKEEGFKIAPKSAQRAAKNRACIALLITKLTTLIATFIALHSSYGRVLAVKVCLWMTQ